MFGKNVEDLADAPFVGFDDVVLLVDNSFKRFDRLSCSSAVVLLQLLSCCLFCGAAVRWVVALA